MARNTEATRYGLRLTLPGAPTTPHVVVGLNGYYWPDRPTPVGAPGELPLEVARRVAEDDSIPVELVELTTREANRATKEIGEFVATSRAHLVRARQEAPGGERVLAVEEMAMTTATEAPATPAAGDAHHDTEGDD